MNKVFYLFVFKCFYRLSTLYRPLILIVAATSGLNACANNGEWLNSDRIERTFGSYGVDVLYSDPGRRVSSLYSSTNGEKITRTYAVVDFSGEPGDAYTREQALIEAGNSIGATFRNAGWTVTKRHLFIGSLEIPAAYADIGELMHIPLPESLATHVYQLNVSKNQRSFDYATITEIHHPDYLKVADLKAIYGEIIFDDSNRDSIQDFIGPSNPRK